MYLCLSCSLRISCFYSTCYSPCWSGTVLFLKCHCIYQWEVNNYSFANWCDFLWRITRRFSNGVQEKSWICLSVQLCYKGILEIWGYTDVLCLSAVSKDQHFSFHITFHTTSSGKTQHLEAGESNSSRGWVPGKNQTFPFSSCEKHRKSTTDHSSPLSNIPLSTHFHPIQYFSLGFYSSSLLTSTICMIIFF